MATKETKAKPDDELAEPVDFAPPVEDPPRQLIAFKPGMQWSVMSDEYDRIEHLEAEGYVIIEAVTDGK